MVACIPWRTVTLSLDHASYAYGGCFSARCRGRRIEFSRAKRVDHVTTLQTVSERPRISVIIPVRNDATALGRTLEHLGNLPGMEAVEVIVAASGDRPGTEGAAIGCAQLLWPSGSSRAQLMNAGAASAQGAILLFLHADSFPPRHAFRLIEHALADPGVVGGAFTHLFAEPTWSLRVISWINRLRYRLTRNYYGDQGIFVRVAVFQQLGGYQDLRLMEDVDFTQRLKRVGRTVVIREPLRTSGRRFLARGAWRTFFFIVWLLLLYTLGLDTQRYAERWRGPADRPPGSSWRPRRQDGTTCPSPRR
jgi:rSAM/selenodomain-associated transferase 2